MPDVAHNAAGSGLPPSPDPRGEAALLLVESLIHALIARATLPIPMAIEVVQVAIDAGIAIADERGTEPEAVRFLAAIASSLNPDAASPA